MLKRLIVLVVATLMQYGCTQDQDLYGDKLIAADQYMQSSDYHSAIKIYEKILAEDPDYPPANYGKGGGLLALYHMGGMENPPPQDLNFLPYLRKAADSVPENAHYGLTYALVVSQIEGCQPALVYFKKNHNRLDQTVSGSPSFGVYYTYTKCLIENGEKDKALLIANEYEEKLKEKKSPRNIEEEIEAINSLINKN